LHERRAANSEHFVWADGELGAEMYRRMSVQSENSVVLQQNVYEWTEMFKNVCKSVKHHKKEPEQQLRETVYTWLVSSQNFLF